MALQCDMHGTWNCRPSKWPERAVVANFVMIHHAWPPKKLAKNMTLPSHWSTLMVIDIYQLLWCPIHDTQVKYKLLFRGRVVCLFGSKWRLNSMKSTGGNICTKILVKKKKCGSQRVNPIYSFSEICYSLWQKCNNQLFLSSPSDGAPNWTVF